MQQYDPQKAAQVWQRVQSQPSPASAPEQVNPLILCQWETAAICRLVSGDALRGILQTAQRHSRCLKGIQILISGNAPAIRTPAAPREINSAALRKCYAGMLRCLGEYEKRSTDPEYGPIFRQLALEQRESCCRMLEYIGSQDRSPK